jgi:hypothetical protein
MTTKQKDDMILIKKTELVEFIQSIGMQFEEQRAMNTGQHTIEISGYQDRGAVFLIDYASHSSQQSKREPSYEALVDFARWTQTFWKHGITIMRKNGLKIESDTPMEKLAFTFYSDLCEIDAEVSHLFEEGYGDKNYKDESDISCQTIKMYPKPYDERIRQAERKNVLEKFVAFRMIANVKIEDETEGNYYTSVNAWREFELLLEELRQSKDGE